MTIARRCIAAAGAVLLTLTALGCEDEVRVYLAPKQPMTQMGGMGATGRGGTGPAPAQMPAMDLAWTVPAGWRLGPVSDMRYATFLVGPVDKPIEMTIIPLGPQAGDVLANVNRWRAQVNLPPVPANELDTTTGKVEAAGATATVVDLLGPAGGDRPRERMLAAILPTPQRVWFFKMKGPDSIVAAEKASFEAFVKSLRISNTPPTELQGAKPGGAAALPAGHPPMPGAGAPATLPAGHPPMPGAGLPAGHPPMPGAGPAGLPTGHPPMPGATGGASQPPAPPGTGPVAPPPGIASWQVPAGWTFDPTPKPFRLATFIVGQGDQEADLSVSKLTGEGGGTLGNINRWRGQVGLPALSDLKDQPSSTVDVDGEKGLLVDLQGPGTQPPSPRMLALLVRHGDDTWFFKLVGPGDTLSAHRAALEAFARSVKWSGGKAGGGGGE